MKQFFRVEYTDKNNPTGQNLNSFFDTWEKAEDFGRWLKGTEELEHVAVSWWIYDSKKKWYICKYKTTLKFGYKNGGPQK